MTQPEACQQLVEKAIAAFGQIDVLVNNAGISMLTRFDEITDLSIFEQVIRNSACSKLSNIYWARISQLNYNILQLSRRAPVYTLDNWFSF